MGATGCMQIQEIVTTGKLSKLEHFETDEKVFWIFLWKLHSHIAHTFFFCSIYIHLCGDGVLRSSHLFSCFEHFQLTISRYVQLVYLGKFGVLVQPRP
jgi:hypothetical protein